MDGNEVEYLFQEMITQTNLQYISDDNEWFAEGHMTYRRKKDIDSEWEEKSISAVATDKVKENAIIMATITLTTYLEDKGFNLFEDENERTGNTEAGET